MSSLFNQIAAVFSSPLGIAVLAFSTLAIAAALLWAFWGRNDVSTQASVKNSPIDTVAPPALAPTMFTGGASAIVPRDFTLRNVFLGVIGVTAVIGAFSMMSGRDRLGDSFGHDNYDVAYGNGGATYGATNSRDQGPFQKVSYSAPGTSAGMAAVTGAIDPICDGGFTDQDGLMGYRLCTGDQAVRFDKIDFSRRGAMLLNASWNGGSGYTLSADNQPAPFAFDEHVAMRGAADTGVDSYDAFVAVGLSEGSLSKDADPARVSAERAYSLGRYVLADLRGETDADCRSRGVVMAISLGHSNQYSPKLGAMKPVLLGVKFDPRYSSADRDLTQSVNEFLNSRGTQITGYDLASFSQREVLFNEVACPRLN